MYNKHEDYAKIPCGKYGKDQEEVLLPVFSQYKDVVFKKNPAGSKYAFEIELEEVGYQGIVE